MARDRAVEKASAWFFKRLEAEEARNPRSSHVSRSGTGVHGGFERSLRGLPDVRVIRVPFERSSFLHRAPSAGCRPPSRTSACFGRQHFFPKYLFTFGTAATLAAVSRYFLEYPAVLKYKDIRRGAAARCSCKVAVVSNIDRAVTWGPRAGRQSRRSGKTTVRQVSCVFSPCVKTQSWAAEPRGWQESERNAGHD